MYVRVSGNSMFPVLKHGDLVLLEKKHIVVGDIVCFQGKQELITHRVIKKEGKIMLTKGDNVGTADGEIKMENVLGKVTLIVREKKKKVKLNYPPRNKASFVFFSSIQLQLLNFLPLLRHRSVYDWVKKINLFLNHLLLIKDNAFRKAQKI